MKEEILRALPLGVIYCPNTVFACVEIINGTLDFSVVIKAVTWRSWKCTLRAVVPCFGSVGVVKVMP